LRNELSHQIARLSNAQLQNIAAKLDEPSGNLEAGIDNLSEKLQRLERTIAILNTFSGVLGLVGRVLAFA
jgi:hypothetical protein